jgi:hypothetical protein
LDLGKEELSRGSSTLAEKKPFLLRLDSKVHEAMQRWADDELRSLNAQIEFVLRRALQQAGKVKTLVGDESTPTDAILPAADTKG